MSNSNLILSYSDDSSVSDVAEIWVRLEQAEMLDLDNYLNFTDIYEMWVTSSMGASAFWYLQENCPINIDGDIITVTLDFYSYPSDIDLNYSVSTDLGVLSEPTRMSEDREFDLKFENSNKATLPFVATDIEFELISRVIHPTRGEISFPSYTIDGSVITLSEPCFAVVRCICKAHYYLHTVTLTFDKEETWEDEDGNINTTGYKIENIQCTETAVWTDENGKQAEDVLDLEIPKCVEEYLARCGDGSPKTTVKHKAHGRRQTVYWSTCTGAILAVYTDYVDE